MAVFAGNKCFAQEYHPAVVTITAPATYCASVTATPLTGNVSMNSCPGPFTALSLNCNWYYNLTNSTNIATATLVSSFPAFTSTSPGGPSVPVPNCTPSTLTPGLYYYFCVVSYPPSICNATAIFVASNTVPILVGSPVFLYDSLAPNPICGNDSVFFAANAVGATSYQWFGPGTSGFATGANPPPFVVNVTDAGVYTITATNSCGTTSATTTLTVNAPLTGATATVVGIDTFCSGGTLTLTATVTGGTGVTYLWSGPGGYTSTMLDPTPFTPTNANSGVYTFTATPGGCPAITHTTHWVQIDDSIILTAVNINPNPICSRHLINLSATETYGTHFHWTGPAGYHSSLLNPIPFEATAANAGVYTLTISNSCNADTMATAPLVVYRSPEPIDGYDSGVCIGVSVTLQFTDSTIDGRWISSDPLVATVNSIGGVVGVSPGIDTIYYVLNAGTDSACYDSVIIKVGRPLGPISGNTVVCVGDSTHLTDPVSGGTWIAKNPNATVGATTGWVTGVSVGTDSIAYQEAGCKPQVVNVTILQSPLPLADSYQVCLGGTITITDASTGGSWSTSPPGIATATGITPGNQATLTGNFVGVDTVYYTTSNGCRALAAVIVDTLPTLAISGNTRICYGQCATLSVTDVDHGTYSWTPQTGVSCTSCDSVFACPLETQNYAVTVTNGAQCSKTLNVKLTVEPLPAITYSPDPFYVCRGTAKTITVQDNVTGDSPDNWLWEPNVFLNSNTIQNPTVSAADSIDLVYTVTATSQFGCKDSIKVPVSVLDSAFVTINPDTIICFGESHQMLVTSTDPRSLFHWYIANGYGYQPASSLNNSVITNPISTPDTSTDYVCIITENACFTDTLASEVYVDPMPVLAVPPLPSCAVAGTANTLTVLITNQDTGLVYEWTPSETINCPSCPTTVVVPDSNMTYHVCVTSNRGCKSCDSVYVCMVCDKSQVFVPNTFTPNGDGYNDRFMVSGKGLGLINHMTVFNRWGEIVYEAHYIPANDASYGWDGTYKGQILEPDVFMYVIEVACETQGGVFKLHGDISLVR